MCLSAAVSEKPNNCMVSFTGSACVSKSTCETQSQFARAATHLDSYFLAICVEHHLADLGVVGLDTECSQRVGLVGALAELADEELEVSLADAERGAVLDEGNGSALLDDYPPRPGLGRSDTLEVLEDANDAVEVRAGHSARFGEKGGGHVSRLLTSCKRVAPKTGRALFFLSQHAAPGTHVMVDSGLKRYTTWDHAEHIRTYSCKGFGFVPCKLHPSRSCRRHDE